MRRHKRNKETLLQFILNWTFTIILACGIGMQVFGASDANLKFAQISDSHFSTIEKDTDYKVLSQSSNILDDVVMQINQVPDIDFTMFTGDLVNKPKESQLMEFINHANCLSAPWYAIDGNHDVQQYCMPKDKFFKILCCHNANFSFEGPYYAFTPKDGYRVICLDTIILDRMTTNGEVDEKQLKWLKDELKEAKNDVVIICMHVPIVEPYHSESHRLLNRVDVLEALHKYDTHIIVCSGHVHGSKIIQDKNILYIDTPSLVTYPCSYRIININNQRKKVIIDVYTKQTRVQSALNTAKMKVLASSHFAGTPEDQNNTFEIEK